MLDVLVIGGGFSDLYALDQLRDCDYTVKIWDSTGDFGGHAGIRGQCWALIAREELANQGRAHPLHPPFTAPAGLDDELRVRLGASEEEE